MSECVCFCTVFFHANKPLLTVFTHLSALVCFRPLTKHHRGQGFSRQAADFISMHMQYAHKSMLIRVNNFHPKKEETEVDWRIKNPHSPNKGMHAPTHSNTSCAFSDSSTLRPYLNQKYPITMQGRGLQDHIYITTYKHVPSPGNTSRQRLHFNTR